MELLKLNRPQVGSNHFNMSIPITKIDTENRMVYGVATADNIDRSGDVVTASASVSAFNAFNGAIREMHQPIAAGKLVHFTQDVIWSEEEESYFNAILVSVYVSKGAESTWQKVLDGTLTGFSIGGTATEQSEQWSPEYNMMVNYIYAYELTELSLVDTPCNQLSNFISILKSKNGDTLSGILSETMIKNVMWCEEDRISISTTDDSSSCRLCQSMMKNIGFFEVGDGISQIDEMGKILNKYLSERDGDGETHKGGVEKMSTDKTEAEVTGNQLEKSADEPNTGAAYVSEASGTDFEKILGDLRESVDSSIAKTISSVETKVADITSAFDEKIKEFEKSFTELSDKVAELSRARETTVSEVEELTKRFNALEKSSAIKKSVDVEPTVGKANKSGLWDGAFFSE